MQDVRDGSTAEVDLGYIKIKFQSGPIKENGVNGCQVKDVIGVLVGRLRGFQRGPFPCDENNMAIEALELARYHLGRRTKDREARGVEGEDKP